MGNATFSTHPMTTDPYFGPDVAGIADIDGDNDPDIIIETTYSIEYFENQGSNQFNQRSLHYFGEQVTSVVCQDIDTDGDMDIGYRLYYGSIGWQKNTTLGEAVPFDKATLGDLPEGTDAGAWADYDLDGDQDLLITAYNNPPITRLYQNVSGNLQVAADFTGLFNGNCAWFDYENDGDPDFVVTGSTVVSSDAYKTTRTSIYINESGAFYELDASSSLPGVSSGHVKAADLDNDGKVEIITTGDQGGIYALAQGAFKKVFAFPIIHQGGRIAISDIDMDGDFDLAITGWLGNDEMGTARTIYINQDNFNFAAQPEAFNGLTAGSLLLHDWDNDADPDLAAIGPHRSGGSNYAYGSFYKNDDGLFGKIERPETGSLIYADYEGAASTGDFDNDGFPDIITQKGSYYRGLELYLNDLAGWYTDFQDIFPDVTSNARFIEPVDFDLDHDLDFMSGNTIVRNNIESVNQRPTPPTQLYDSVRNNILYTFWAGSTDTKTPVSGLTYQVYVGSAVGAQDILSSDADLTTGVQFVQHYGPARKLWKVKIPTGGNLYWVFSRLIREWLHQLSQHRKLYRLYTLRAPTVRVQKQHKNTKRYLMVITHGL